MPSQPAPLPSQQAPASNQQAPASVQQAPALSQQQAPASSQQVPARAQQAPAPAQQVLPAAPTSWYGKLWVHIKVPFTSGEISVETWKIHEFIATLCIAIWYWTLVVERGSLTWQEKITLTTCGLNCVFALTQSGYPLPILRFGEKRSAIPFALSLMLLALNIANLALSSIWARANEEKMTTEA